MTKTNTMQEPASTSGKSPFAASLQAACAVFQTLSQLESDLNLAARLCCEAIKSGNKLLACGNGGSACEASHLVGELMGHYKKDRPALSAVALSADSALLTCIGNDYCFDEIFSRQIEALCNPNDVVIAFTTSGNSKNVLKSLEMTRRRRGKSIAFLGGTGGAAKSLADCSLVIPHSDTARIQEAHQFLLHCLMDSIEQELSNAS